MKYYIARWGHRISGYFDNLEEAKKVFEDQKQYERSIILLSCTNNYRNRKLIIEWERSK